MIVTERLLGYDVRVSQFEKLNWNKERREEYLIRQDIDKPLSVDKWVWEKSEFNIESPKVNYLTFFYDLVEITGKSAQILNIGQSSLIKITIVANDEDQEVVDRYFMQSNTIESNETKPDIWKFLGYDVCDSGLISGLMNCSHKNASKTESKKWADALNKHHLFESLEKSFEFKSYTDKTVQEHAPFFVFGIYVYAATK